MGLRRSWRRCGKGPPWRRRAWPRNFWPSWTRRRASWLAWARPLPSLGPSFPRPRTSAWNPCAWTWPELDGVLECLREASGRLSSLKGQVQASGQETLEQLERELELAHDRAGRMRLLPAGALFAFLERTCRDAAEALGKRVRFEAKGREARLDAPVLSALQEALQHVVRNAVVHGIEERAQRLAAGKAAEGRVRVELRPGIGPSPDPLRATTAGAWTWRP